MMEVLKCRMTSITPGIPFVLFLFLASILGFQTYADSSPGLRGLKAGDPVPPFKVKGSDGKTIEKENLKGKVILLLFVRAEQDTSLEVLKEAQRLESENIDSDLYVLAVFSKALSEDYFQQLASELGLAFPILLDQNRKMYGEFGLIVTPTTLLIDENGILRYEFHTIPPSFDRKLHIHTDYLLKKISREEHDALLARVNQTRSRVKETLETRLAFIRILLEREEYELALQTLAHEASEETAAYRYEIATLYGQAYLALGHAQEAAKYLDPLAGDSSCPPAFKEVLARLEIHRGNYQIAEALLLEVLKSPFDKSRAFFLLGQVYERMNQPEKALSCYRQALESLYKGKL